MLYAVVTLGWVDRDGSGQVPFFSTWLVIILLIASVLVLARLVLQVVRRLRTALHDLARTLPPFRQEAIYRYMLHLDTSVKASIADPDDQLEALQQDQQGLGPSRQQQPGQAE